MTFLQKILSKLTRSQEDNGARSPDLLALEERVLYSASPIPLEVLDGGAPDPEVVDSVDHLNSLELQPFDTTLDEIALALEILHDDVIEPPVTPTTELVIIDTAVENYQQLVDDLLDSVDLSRNFETVFLSSSSGGIEQLTEIFSTRRGLDAVHLISHGSDGRLQIGNSSVDSEQVQRFEEQIASWNASFNTDADFLIYGCDVASTDEGESFIVRLGELTGTDVAASDDITGNQENGGDWEFEFTVGDVQRTSAFSFQLQTNWQGELLDYESASDGGTAGSLAVDQSGNRFVVVTADSDATDGQDVVLFATDSSGNQILAPITVNATTNGDQKWASVAVSESADRVAVVWTQDNSGTHSVVAKVFDRSGNVIRSDFRVDAIGSGGNDAAIAMNESGNFVVTWEGSGAADGDGVYARRFDQNGVALDASPFSVNDVFSTVGIQGNADVSVNAAGDFVIAWDSYSDSNTESEIFARRFEADGSSAFQTVVVSTADQIYSHASVNLNDDGDFVIAYTSDSTDDAKSGPLGAVATAEATGVEAKLFNQLNSFVRTYTIADTSNGRQENVTALVFEDESVAFSWEGEGVSGTGVYFNEFDASGIGNSEALLFPTLAFNGGSDTPSPIRGASIVDPTDPGYVVWNELANATIVKTGASTFLGGLTGVGYPGTVAVEGYHFSTGQSVGNIAPTLDASDESVVLSDSSSDGAVVFDIDATDPEGAGLVYLIADGDPGGVFAIDANGVITVSDSSQLDAGVKASYDLLVTVTDQDGSGLTIAKSVTVNLVTPDGDDISLAIAEDVPYTFTSADFEATTAGTVTRVIIEQVPSSGDLFLNGEIVSAGQTIMLTEIDVGGLVYLPRSDYAGTDGFEFRLGDGVTLSASTSIATISIAATAETNFIAGGTELASVNGGGLINETINGQQEGGRITALAGGGYVVVWQSVDNDLTDGDQGEKVYYRIYDASGNPTIGETLVDGNSTDDQFEASVTGLGDGGFVVVWTSDNGSEFEVMAQRYNAVGVAVEVDGVSTDADPEFVVAQNTAFNQLRPRAAALSDGGFVITWSTTDPAADDTIGVAARVYTQNGLSTNEFTVNDTALGAQRDSDVIGLEGNRFVVGWVDQTVNDFDIKAKIYDAGDLSSGTEFTVNTTTLNRDSNLDLEALANGRFVVSWQANGAQDGQGFGVFAQVFEADGAAVGNEFQVNQTTTGHQQKSQIQALADGGFLVLWDSPGNDDDGTAIVARRFDANGAPVGNEFTVNSRQAGNQANVDVAALLNGTVVVTWDQADGDNEGAGFSTGVYTEQFQFAASGVEDSPVALDLNAVLLDSDGSESFQLIEISNVPSGAFLSDGSGNSSTIGDSAVDVTTWNLSGIQVNLPADSHENFELTILTRTVEATNADVQTATQTLQVIVGSASDPIIKSDFSSATDADSTVNIAANDLTSGVSTVDSQTLTILPDSSFDNSTLPPGNAGGHLSWDNGSSNQNIRFDVGVSFTEDSGSLIPNMSSAFVFDGSAGGTIRKQAFDGVFHDDGGIELWIRPDSLSGQHILFEWGDETDGIALYQDGSKVILRIHQDTTVNGFDTEPYELVADGLVTGEFNQIFFMVAGDSATPLGDPGQTPDAQLYLNGQFKDQLIDIPGYSSRIHFHNFDDAALGTRIGTAAGDDVAFTNFEGQIARFEVYSDLDAGSEVEARYLNQISDSLVVNVEGQNYASGTTVALGSGAEVTVNADGSLTYDPNGAFDSLTSGNVSQDSFSYTLQNALGVSEAVTVTVDVSGVANNLPTSNSNTIGITEDLPYTLVEADFGFNDVDGDAFDSLQVVTAPVNGDLFIDGVLVTDGDSISIGDIHSGRLVFVSEPDQNGAGYDSFVFRVQDDQGQLQASTSTITFNVANDNADVSLTDDAYNTSANVPINEAAGTGILGNDTSESGAINVIDYSQAANGNVQVNADGSFVYTPDSNFDGNDSFSYVADSGANGLTHYWGLGGNAVDSVGGADGTVDGAVSIEGNYGDGLAFNGSSDIVRIPDFAYGDSFTLSFDFRLPTNGGSGFQYLYSHGTIFTQNSLNIFIGEDGSAESDQLVTALADSDDVPILVYRNLNFDISGIVGDGLWHTYTLVLTDNDGARVYLDGVEQNSTNHGVDATLNPNGDLILGGRNDFQANRFFGGDLDTVQMFDRALDTADVAALSAAPQQASVNITVNPGLSLSGSVLEDLDGNGQLGDAVSVDGATVLLYQDDGDGVIDAADTLVSQVQTDASGSYQFSQLIDGETYWVAVDSKTIQSSQAVNTGYGVDDTWAEQTYGDGGTLFGGRSGGTSDDSSSLVTSQHISRVDLGGANISGVDFGFSFNVVTHSQGGDGQDDDAATNDRSVQGSLRQFITNANALAGNNAMRFVPATAVDRTHSGETLWEIEVSVALPTITDEGTTIDGRAYATDGNTLRNSNSTVLGYVGAVGVGADGVPNTGDESQLLGLDAPELEISDVNGVSNGISVTASNTEISHVAIHGFSNANIQIHGAGVSNAYVHHNLIGSRAHEFFAPNTAGTQGNNIFVLNADAGIIENNLIGFAGEYGIVIQGASDLSDAAENWQIRFNEIRANSLQSNFDDGIRSAFDTSGLRINSNLITENRGGGIDTLGGIGSVTISENTIEGNGTGGVQTFGVRLFGANNSIELNAVENNVGPGILVIGDNASEGVLASTGNQISQNSFVNNGSIGIDLVSSSNSQTFYQSGDGLTLNDGSLNSGTGNQGLDHPELSGVVLDGTDLEVTFQMEAIVDRIELYLADPGSIFTQSGSRYGQGSVYLGTLAFADLSFNSTTGLYTGRITQPGTGWPALLSSGRVTAIAIDNDTQNTSEFGNAISVAVGSAVPVAVDSNVRFDEDVEYVFAETDFNFTDPVETEFQFVRVDSLPVRGTLMLRGTAVNAGDAILATEIQAGELTYLPATDESGDAYASFRFSVNDGVHHSSNMAEMELNVNAVNDAPEFTSPNTYIVPEHQNDVGNVATSDAEGDSIFYTISGGSDSSRFTINPTTGLLDFSSLPDYDNPSDVDRDNVYEVTVRANDGQGGLTDHAIQVQISDVDDAPVAAADRYNLNEGETLDAASVLGNDTTTTGATVQLVSGPDYGNLTLNSDGTFQYSHGGAEVHSVQFVYEVADDSGLSDQASVQLVINPVDDNPVAVNDSLIAFTGIELNVQELILENDFDADSRISGVQVISSPANGELIVDRDGQLVFVPDEGFTGETRFEYQITSNGQSSRTAVVVIDVSPLPGTENETNTEDEETRNDSEESGEDDPLNEIDPSLDGSNPSSGDGDGDSNGGGQTSLPRADISDSFADVRNSDSTGFEFDEINLDSDEYTSIATYVYSSDIEIIETDLGYRGFQSTRSNGVSQFEQGVLAAAFLQELDSAKDQFFVQFDISMPSLAMAGTSFLTVGYLAWMVRGGILLTTFVSSIPAWKMLDPLAVLEAEHCDEGGQDDQSIGQMVDR